MEKRMEAVTVKTGKEGNILIEQEYVGNDQPNVIEITPDQVDVIVQWLQEAKAELQKKTK
jgi:hypothetical protein